MGISHDIRERLLAYAAGELTGAAASEVETLMASDAEAARLVRSYRAVARAARADAATVPAQDLAQRARAIFRAPVRAPRESWLDRAGAAIARLVFDSRLQPMMVRDADDRVQMAFESDDLEIDLQMRRRSGTGNGWRLDAQVTGVSEFAGAAAAAVSENAPAPSAVVDMDDRGRFRMELEPGRYDVVVRGPRGALILPGIRLE
jgi:anti-sigma factor RsiW